MADSNSKHKEALDIRSFDSLTLGEILKQPKRNIISNRHENLTDSEDRKLQMKLAQLNADLQVYLATFFGFLAGSITLAVLEFQFPSWAILFGISALVFLSSSCFFLYKLIQCHKAFKSLK